MNEVQTTASLYLRLVTKDMLYNSVRVRLSGLGPCDFLSELYERFRRGVAAIVPTTEDNVFIIDILQAKEEAGRQVGGRKVYSDVKGSSILVKL